MAIEWHYVASDGTDTWANSTNSGTPCSLDTALANLAAGIGVYLKAGTYSRSASDAITADGSATSPIIFAGCDASWNVLTPSRNATTKLLDATNYPIIDYGAGNYNLNAEGSNYSVFRCIKVSGARAAGQLQIGMNGLAYGCVVVNAANSANAIGLYSNQANPVFDNCDAACTGTSSGPAIQGASAVRIINCVSYGSKGNGINLGASAVLINCLIYGHAGYGAYFSSTSATHYFTLYGVTIYGGSGFYTGDAAFTNLSYIGCCHITDGGAYAIQNPNATGSSIVLSHNRTRDNTSGEKSWVGDYVIDVGGSDTNTGDQATDYKAYASSNFTLVTTAPGATLGQFGQPVGALPPGDWPLLANVVSPETMNGDTGTFVEADRNTDPGEANVKTGTSYKILNVTKNGSYSASGGGGRPEFRGSNL